MTTTYAPHGHVRRPHLSGSRKTWWTWVPALVVGAILVGVAAWAAAERVGNDSAASPGAAAPMLDLQWSGDLRAADVRRLETVLRTADYALPVDGVLDPVTKSAAADFLRAADLQQLEPWIAGALTQTVITSRRDPVAWNARFGEGRTTRMVERPLTGHHGQLDENGNNRTGG